ncbi:acyl-CoA thioesterase [Aestuariimicrobium sp. T2.26MG-19.2B]|uniref:acyl-CoA thioesterase n=1 Tax=Aestuariimicrobium sp. T2.26MG-19.2B TaxID=3040679 RepID=UPI002477AA5C|nr:acyl-CoA thioesterase II [Aestuariimicrobium sp. T2.26MG-19.2B]CAI9408603.1 Acyl-CoA thioesterase 2 [Aestuariimicrobium sp. T2.26MG-19.2B]
MPATTAELVDLLSLEEIELGLYRGSHPRTTWQRTFGGQVLAQALMAAYGTMPAERICHSLNAYFLRPGSTDAPIIYDVERTRDGHTFSARRVLARQRGTVIFTLSASFHELEEGLEHSDPAPVNVPAPEQCRRLSEVMSERFGSESSLFHEWDALDVRFAGDSGRSGEISPSSHRAHMRVWVRTTEGLPDDHRLHQAVTAYLSDMTLLGVSTVPHEVAFLSAQLQAASIDHAMWFHRPIRADQWILYDQVSPSASNALGFSMGRLLQDGLQVATCNQEGLIRVVPGTARH